MADILRKQGRTIGSSGGSGGGLTEEEHDWLESLYNGLAVVTAENVNFSISLAHSANANSLSVNIQDTITGNTVFNGSIPTQDYYCRFDEVTKSYTSPNGNVYDFKMKGVNASGTTFYIDIYCNDVKIKTITYVKYTSDAWSMSWNVYIAITNAIIAAN